MQMILNRSKTLILVVLSFSLTSFFFGTDPSFIRIDGSFDSYDSGVIAASYNATNDIASAQESEAEYSDTSAQAQTIWSRLRDEFQLDHYAQSERVQKEIRALLADKEKLYQILQASAPYIYFINQQVEARKLPAELALIPVIESEFDPYDHSNKGASGLWQLMPQTARDFGIKVRDGYDGRRNVVKSTNAALTYFNDLQRLFNGDWYLAMAAYNSGEGSVMHAEKREGSDNFWDLSHLPKETRLYVPRLLAVAAIIQNPQKYGVQLPPVKNAPYFAQATVNKSVDFSKIAQETGIDTKVLQKLNPDYKGSAPAKGAVVLLPLADLSQIRSQFSDEIAV